MLLVDLAQIKISLFSAGDDSRETAAWQKNEILSKNCRNFWVFTNKTHSEVNRASINTLNYSHVKKTRIFIDDFCDKNLKNSSVVDFTMLLWLTIDRGKLIMTT